MPPNQNRHGDNFLEKNKEVALIILAKEMGTESVF